MTPALSILVCSVGDRLDRMVRVYDALAGQAVPYCRDVEILVLTDNRCRSIGLKRQALLDVARGDYLCFVDDDDNAAGGFVTACVAGAAERPDVVVFPTTCASNEFGDMLIEHSIGNPNEEARMPGFKRKPWFMHPIRREIAQSSRFPNKSWGEDAEWLAGVWPHLQREFSASAEPLYTYHWNDAKPNPDKPK